MCFCLHFVHYLFTKRKISSIFFCKLKILAKNFSVCYTLFMRSLDYRQLEFGFSKIPKNDTSFNFARHMHNTWEIYFLKSDKVLYNIDAITYRLKPNDLLIIPPRTYHNRVSADERNDYQRFTLNFRVDLLPKTIQEMLVKLPYHHHVPVNSSVYLLFDEILAFSDDMSEEELYDAVESLIELTIIELSHNEQYSTTSQNSIDQLLSDILTYIKSNITDPLTIDDLCKRFFLSRSKLSHLFSQKINVGVTQYINLQKILYAQQLIIDGTQPTTAANAVGYQNYSTFYRQYKKLLNRSPENDKSK